VKLIAKHLPLLALALLVSSTELRAEELPLKAGDLVRLSFTDRSEGVFEIMDIKGKWIKATQPEKYTGVVASPKWLNSDHILVIQPQPRQ